MKKIRFLHVSNNAGLVLLIGLCFLRHPKFANTTTALHGQSTLHVSYPCVAKMASHAIFQYNILAIDDIHNTWTNMIVKMTILRLLDSSDDKEKEKEKIGGSQGSALKALRIRITGRTDA